MSHPNLLISCRNVDEVRLCFQSGIQFIDAKEPRNGSLGRPGTKTLADIAATLADNAVTCSQGTILDSLTLSCAHGELADLDAEGARTDVHATRALTAFDWCKFGHSQLATDRAAAIRRWQWLDSIFYAPEAQAATGGKCTMWVPVFYADHAAANAPAAIELLRQWLDHNRHSKLVSSPRDHWCVLDTWDKSTGSLLDKLDIDSLRMIARMARQSSVRIAAAGSLRAGDIRPLARLGFDLMGLRGGVCAAGRESAIDQSKLRSVINKCRPANYLGANINTDGVCQQG